jgi:hypothetical protein
MWDTFIAILRDLGIRIEAGLTDAEVRRAESEFHFRFPPDLRAFLRAGLPLGEGFPTGRMPPATPSSPSIRRTSSTTARTCGIT